MKLLKLFIEHRRRKKHEKDRIKYLLDNPSLWMKYDFGYVELFKKYLKIK